MVHKIKVDYFRKCLLKDAEYYDNQNPNEMSIKISKETDAIHKGIGEKAGIVVMSFSSFFLGYLFSFFLGWKLTLILMGALPILGMIGAGMALSTMSGFSEEMKAYAQSAGYAEQALNAIRVVHSFGQEALEFANYNKYLARSK